MVLTAQRSLFGRARVPAPIGLLPIGHSPAKAQTPRANVGVLSPNAAAYSPHGKVELILESQPPTRYHGQSERRVLSPVKNKTAAQFRHRLRLHDTRQAVAAAREAALPARPRDPRRSLGQRFPRELIREAEQRVVSCKAGADSAHTLAGSVSAPALLTSSQQKGQANTEDAFGGRSRSLTRLPTRLAGVSVVYPEPGSPEGRARPKNAAALLRLADKEGGVSEQTHTRAVMLGESSDDEEGEQQPAVRGPKPRSSAARPSRAASAGASRRVTFDISTPPTVGAAAAAAFEQVQLNAQRKLQATLEERERCRESVFALRHAIKGKGFGG